MKKIIKSLKLISTIVGFITLLFFALGMLVWGIDFESIKYGKSEKVSSENLNNEGPFVFETDSTYLIKYIKGDSENGFYLSEYIQSKSSKKPLKCHYYLEDTDFSFTLETSPANDVFEFQTPNKIITISDIEGNYKTFRNFLIANKVIDENLNWIFENGHLVLNGDFVDRGHFTTQVLWFIGLRK